MHTTAASSERHHVFFLFDPVCPWAWRASLWIRAVSRIRPVDVEWGLLSLEYLNRQHEDHPHHEVHLRSRLPLRLLSMARRTAGNAGLDNLYLAVGDLRYEQGRELDDETVLSDALVRADLPASLLEEARSNEALDEALQRQYEHAWLSGAFGVPTIYIDHSEVPYFGPVIASIPPEEEAGDLWDLILGISRYPYFYELKRERR